MSLPIKLLKKSAQAILILSFFASIAAGFYLTQNAPAQAQEPCEEEAGEYHSLRPYPAEPCDDEPDDLALFCGNQLILQDTVSASEGSCTTQQDGSLRCTVTNKSTEISIDLAEAEFPILGNTQDVKRVGTNQNDQDLEDSVKTNEYVSWYLHGVAWKAEYPPYDPTTTEGKNKIVDFSGPINKLLPWEIQMRKKYETLENASDTRHNQIVACGVLGKIVECGSVPSLAANEIRLSEIAEAGEPPYPSEFENFNDYWLAYRRWQGNLCTTIPGINVNLCVPNPLNVFNPNYTKLYSYIPYSSTEDRVGRVSANTFNVQPASESLTITDASFVSEPADLYFAHAEESAELTELLQKTYLPEGEAGTGPSVAVSPSEQCDLVHIRTNPGDDLHAGEIIGNLTYSAEFTCQPTNAEDIECREACLAAGNPFSQCLGLPPCSELDLDGLSCTKNANITLSLQTETPRADEIWSRTVAGPSAIFKRIFPKIGVGAPILGIVDIPAATRVVYSSGQGSVAAGNPGNQRSGQGAELYFPHIGGVSEYFLKGIQTALRPQGFGEPILSGELAPGTCSDPGSLPLSGGGGSCGLCNTGDLSGYLSRFGYSSLPPTMVSVLESAGSAYDVPASLLLGILYAEGGLERYEWTEELAREASVCGGQVPNCSTYNVSSTGAVGPFQWIPSHFDQFSGAVKAVDPSREGDPCNFMDAAFAAAQKLHLERGGAVSYSPAQCGGITYNTAGNGRGISTSCSDWNDQDAATAARQYAGQCVEGYQAGVIDFFNRYQCQ